MEAKARKGILVEIPAPDMEPMPLARICFEAHHEESLIIGQPSRSNLL
jgi:hypothetical protein